MTQETYFEPNTSDKMPTTRVREGAKRPEAPPPPPPPPPETEHQRLAREYAEAIAAMNQAEAERADANTRVHMAREDVKRCEAQREAARKRAEALHQQMTGKK